MTDTSTTNGKHEAATLTQSHASFSEFLQTLCGRIITFVNPESLEDAPMGYVLKTGFYRSKLLSVHDDYLVVASELIHKAKEATKEPVRQFLPLSQIKRVTVGKSDILFHI